MAEVTKKNVKFKTGGTTSDEKFLEIPFENLEKEASELQSKLQFPYGLEFITTTTTAHRYGYTFLELLPKLCEGKVYPNKINYSEDVTIENAVLITTPSFLEALRKHDAKFPINPKIIISAGAKLEKETFDFAKSVSKKVWEVYGSTETGVMAYKENYEDKFKLLDGIEILETTEDYTKIRSDYAISAKTPIIIEDKIEYSNGEILFLSRQGRVLKIQEKRVNAVEIEKEILKLVFLEECYCFENKGKLALAGVLSKNGIDFVIENDKFPLDKKIKEFSNKNFGITPQKIKYLAEIPKTNAGKIDRKKIREIFGQNISLPIVVSQISNSNVAEYELYFLKNSNFFKGHFEGFPILAGVVQLYFANYFSNLAFGLDCRQGQLRKIKFSNIIFPNKIIKLRLEKSETNISYSYSDSEKKYSSGIFPIKNYL